MTTPADQRSIVTRTPASRARTARRTRLRLLVAGTLSLALGTADRGEAAALRPTGLPMAFEVNHGQAGPGADFVARGRGYAVALGRGEAAIALSPAAPAADRRRPPAGPRARAVVRMRLVGVQDGPPGQGEQPGGPAHYLLGPAPQRWRPNVATYARVRYRDVYPGVDLVYYGNGGRLEYDLVLRPGADPRAILLEFTAPVRIDGRGNLRLATPGGDLVVRRPHVYQDIAGVRRPVAAGFALRPPAGGSAPRVGFDVAAHDPARVLVIDPVLDYSTYLGGAATDVALAVAVGPDGHVHLAGHTDSADFSDLVGGPQGLDAFVARIAPDGASIAWTAYVGGAGTESATGVAVDAAGQVYVTGATDSADFPVVNGVHGHQGGTDAFVVKLAADGSRILYATHLGGTDDDAALAIALGPAGHVHVAGVTASTDYPRRSAIHGDKGLTDAFVTRLDTTQAGHASLVASTYLGGNADEEAHAIALDTAGNVLVAGWTDSTNFPRVNGYQGDRAGRDAFLAVLAPDGAALLYSTYLGGAGTDAALGVAAGDQGYALVTGFTDSDNFPLRRPVQPGRAGGSDAFVAVLDPRLTGPDSLVAGTYLGGSQDDAGVALTLDADGHALLAGWTASSDFPVVNPLHGARGRLDAFVARLDAVTGGAGSLRFASYLGGAGDDEALAVAADGQGAVYVAGVSTSPDFPAHQALFPAPRGGQDAFLVRLSDLDRAGPDLVVAAIASSPGVAHDGTVGLDVDVRNQGEATAGASMLRLFLSEDALLDGADLELDARPVAALAGGETGTHTLRLTLPPVTASHYHVLAVADADEVVWESHEANNVLASSRVMVAPDLVVSGLAIPAMTRTGGIVEASVRIENLGSRPAPTSTVNVYLARHPALGSSSDLLLANRTVPPLAPGEGVEIATTLTVPVKYPAGTHHVIAVADAGDEVAESDETNNTRADAIVIGADLVVTDLLVPAGAGPGTNITVTDTTVNASAMPAPLSITTFYLSEDAVLDDGDAVLPSRVIPPLQPGDGSTGSTRLWIPPTVTGPFHVIAVANAGGHVEEARTDNNVRISPPIALAGDLTAWVELPSGSGHVAAGGTITVTDYTKNEGTIPSPATRTRISLTLDAAPCPSPSIHSCASPGTGDILLGQREVPPLAPGELSVASTQVTVPATLAAGTYYVLVRANGDGAFLEANLDNNFIPPARRLAVGADLVVSLDVPGAATLPAGGPLALRLITRNASPVPVGASLTRIYLSRSGLLDGDAIAVGTRTVPALAADTADDLVLSLDLDPTLGGVFHVVARANENGAVVETDTTNNTAASKAIALGPDLRVYVNLPGSAAISAPGTAIELEHVAHNAGAVAAPPSLTRFYLSRDGVLDGGDVAIGSQAIPALAANTQQALTTPVTLPEGLGGGTYHLIGLANADGAVAESDRTNNTSVSPPLAIGTDLTAWVALPAGSSRAPAGGAVPVEVYTKNLGGVDAPASVTRVWLARGPALDPARDVALLDVAVPPVPRKGLDARTVAVPIPATVAGGTYHVIVQANATGVVAETDTGNNFTGPARPIIVGADLRVGLDVPGGLTLPAGGPLVFRSITRNASPVPVGPSLTRYYLSASTGIDAGALLVGTRRVPALAADGVDDVTVTLDLDPGIGGVFRVVAHANADGAVVETDETNNTAASKAIALGPDLRVYVDLPGSAATAAPGAVIHLTHVAHNAGAVAAPPSVTRFHLSRDAVLDAGDVLLGSQAIPALAANTQQVFVTPVTLPAVLASGAAYRIIGHANGDGAVAESSTANNTSVSPPFTIGADLTAWVALPAGSSRAAAGGAVPVEVSTKNLGGVGAAASTTRVWLARGTTLDGAQDIALLDVPVPALPVSGLDVRTVSIPIPPAIGGGVYHVIVQANATGAAVETDATNNVTGPARRILVGADLRVAIDVAGAAHTLPAGGPLPLRLVTRNASPVPAWPSVTRVYLSPTPGLDPHAVLVHARAVPALAADTADDVHLSLPLPPEVAGTFHVVALANADGAVVESDDTNNLAVSQRLVVGPDLVVAGLTVRAGARAGEVLHLNDATRNRGGSASRASMTAFYLSTDPVLDAGDLLLATRPVPPLPAGAWDAATTPALLPTALASGPYFVIGVADANGDGGSINHADNVMATPLEIAGD